MHASIDSLDTSLTATFAPYLDSARATPLPMFGPQPVTRATLPSSETSNAYLHLSRASARITQCPNRDAAIMWRAHEPWQSAHGTELASAGLGNGPTSPRHPGR